MKQNALLTLLVIVILIAQLASAPIVMAANTQADQPNTIFIPLINGPAGKAPLSGDPLDVQPTATVEPSPMATEPAPTATVEPSPTATQAPTIEPTLPDNNDGMVDVWVFVDEDENGIYSSGDNGLTDALVCLSRTGWNSCVGTDLGDVWWEDLPTSSPYASVVDPETVAGHDLRSIRCEETGSRVEYAGCSYQLGNWTADFTLAGGKRINIFYALQPTATEEPAIVPTLPDNNDGMVDVWVFVDEDLNGIYSSGDNGLTDALVCLSRTGWNSCVGTDLGDVWWEDLPTSSPYASVVDPETVAGHDLRSIRCEETGSRVEYAGCSYQLGNWTADFTLAGGKRINIFYALQP